ncbi:4-amino-4-deoxy-L-arabinose-phosphoundecaprenol flippase subunit ArnF [Pantoea sp. B65]|uniref:4-amino-4-deoxy-L-arabinose-phosphoundecaprenol flippase subunit ArnF n=1 Tax=Pantoea sp. B65 TaxID=2813359 RepID=UPI0039B59AD5
MTGYLWAAISILLVSGAQLSMKWAMSQLPPARELLLFGEQLMALTPGALALFAGLTAYGLSMLCWVLALHHISLNRAYPLLSLSYILVWLAAPLVPGLNETFSWATCAGVILIVCGLMVICWPDKQRN